ncbi:MULTISPECIES: helix-turn-helix domain-containing protein [Streptomyces]
MTVKRPTQKEAAKRLNCSDTSLSRFLSGHYVPGKRFIRNLHKAACSDASDEAVGITVYALEALHAQAEPRRCPKCTDLSEMVASLSTQILTAQSGSAILLQTIEDLESKKAGLEARLAVHYATTQLPVPRRRRDRQLMSIDVSAVRGVAVQAQTLHEQGDPGMALTLLRQTTTEVLSPVESAATLALLRQQHQDELAENLIRIYGRDQPDEDVMCVALELHERGLTSDAGAVLRAAVG